MDEKDDASKAVTVTKNQQKKEKLEKSKSGKGKISYVGEKKSLERNEKKEKFKKEFATESIIDIFKKHQIVTRSATKAEIETEEDKAFDENIKKSLQKRNKQKQS